MKILFFLLLYLSTVSTVIVISPLLQKLLRNEYVLKSKVERDLPEVEVRLESHLSPTQRDYVR